MIYINKILQYCYEQGWSRPIYDNFKYPTLGIHVGFLLLHQKHYKISAIKAVLAAVFVFAFGNYLSMILGWVENGFKHWGVNNIIRVYVYLPFLCILIAKLLKEDPIHMLTLLTPNIALQQVVGHIVCVFPGCCAGYPCSWGIWNPSTDSLLFPVQWLECIVALVIFLFILNYQKKRNYATDGKVYPVFMILFGVTRFFLEFLRDNEKLLLGMSSFAFHSLFMVAVGIVWIMVLDEKQKLKEAKIKARKKK